MKKYLPGAIALVLAMSLSSFKTSRDTQVYHFTGQTVEEEEVASNYERGSVSCPSPAQIICTITAPSDQGPNPDFSSSNPVSDPTAWSPITKKAN